MDEILAIDIGTTHCKAITFNMKGEAILSLKETYATIADEEGKSEQDPDEIFEAVLNLIQQALRKHPEIKGISFSAAMHSLIAIDKKGKPLTHAITWADIRSKAYAEELMHTELGDKIYHQTGTPIHPMSPLCKIIWIRNEYLDMFNNTSKFISIKEYIFCKLFGKYIVDVSIASATGLFDIYNKTWFDEALKVAGITAEQLSTPVAAIHIETELLPEYKALLKSKGEIAFILGGNDGSLANIGCGAITPGEVALTIGTSGAIRITTDQLKKDDKKRLFNYIITDDLFITGGPANNGGIVLKWFTELFNNDEETETDIDKILELASEADAGAGNLIFLPYLLGERAPMWDANAKGVFFGLDNLHEKKHLARAVVEGICFGMNDILVALEETNGNIENIYASGGFIQSRFWLQVLADIFGKRIIISNVADASATGAAIIGMKALGWIEKLEDARFLLHKGETFEPSEELHEKYKKLFVIFQILYVKLRDEFHALSNLQNG
jgi:gluconokinase